MGTPRCVLPAVVAIAVLIAGCNGRDDGEPAQVGPGRSDEARATVRTAEPTHETGCDVGGSPDYFVPGGDDGPFAIIGCARLGVSGKPVEFSADFERIGGEDHVCIDPAYRGRGQMGIYIPAICLRDPISRALAVVDVAVPRQGVRGYQLVIWGTADPATRRVVARYAGEETQAAVFTLDRALARSVGATKAFTVFVVELHREAACQRVRIQGDGGASPSTSRTERRPKICHST